MKPIFIIFLAYLLSSCNSGEQPMQDHNTGTDSAMVSDPSVSSGAQPHDDLSAAKDITVNKPANATLGFSYYPVIPQNETRDLRVFVRIEGSPENVRNTIRQIEKEDLEFTQLNDSSVVCIIRNIQAYKKLSIKPLYDFEDFKITKVDDSEPLAQRDPNEQELDFVNGNYWHWKVKAIAKTAHLGNITLLIRAETPAGEKIKLAERQINIKIDINEPKLTLAQKAYNFADAHFKEILSLIIIPLVIYLFNLLRKRRIAERNNELP